MDNFSYLIPKSGPCGQQQGGLLSVHLEFSCPSAGSALSAYLESDVSVVTPVVLGTRRLAQATGVGAGTPVGRGDQSPAHSG